MEKFKRFDILLGNSILRRLFHFDNLPFTLYTFENSYEMRNAFRFRRAPRRTIQKNQIDSGVLEQLTAIKLGLAEDVRNS